MLASLSVWTLAVVLSQTSALAPVPAETAWLKAIPADVDVAVRVQGMESTRADLMAMLRAMSPALAERAEPALAGHLAEFQRQFGDAAVKTPWVGLLRLQAPGDDGKMPFAVLVLSDDQPGVLRVIHGGKDPELKAQDGGYHEFQSPPGEGVCYTAKGPGFVAFGPDKTLIAAIARPGEKTLDKALTPELTRQFLSGDLGAYVNASSLVKRFDDQIDQARQTLMNALDQAGQQAGNAASMNAAKEIYGFLFDSLKDADVLTVGVDAAAEGLSLGGVLGVKTDSPAAKTFVNMQAGTAGDLTALPADAAFYGYMNLSAETFDRLQGMSLQMLNPGGKPSPEQAKALGQFGKLGRIETIGGMTMAGGMRGMNVTKVSDPEKFIAASQTVLQAMKGEGAAGLYKDVKVEPAVEKYQGITFTHIVATLDFDKFAQLNPNNPGGVEALKSMFGGDVMSSWLGTDGKRVFQVTAPTWNEVKAQVDAFLKGENGLGALATYKQIRSRLPEQASGVMLLNAQGLVRMFANQLAATFKKPELKVSADVPGEPVLFGGSLTPRPPAGIEFHFVLPSQAGPIFEKGLVPLFKGITPPKNP